MDPDPLEELNRMADAITATTTALPTTADLQRWTDLFSYTPAQAHALILAHRASLTRLPITDAHWELVRPGREAAGYDREAYEHSLGLRDLIRSQSSVVTDREGKTWFLVRLGGWLSGVGVVRGVLGLGEGQELRVTVGEGEGGVRAEFVWLDAVQRERVEGWVEERARGLGGVGGSAGVGDVGGVGVGEKKEGGGA